MVTDIILDAPDADRRLVIDTKFTSILGTGRFGDASLKSGYLYQMVTTHPLTLPLDWTNA
jgi:5-methylcytosine-specific restriction enzyme subunit McrC